MKINEAELQKALDLLFVSDATYEVRVLKKDRPPRSGYFTDHGALVRAVENIQLTRPDGIYFTLNPVDPSLINRCDNRIDIAHKTTTDKEVIRRRLFVMDFDPDRATNTSSTDVEHEAAIEVATDIRQLLIDDFGFASGVLADSGNGAHLIYKIDLENNKEIDCLISDCLNAVVQMYFDHDGKTERNGVKVSFDTTIKNPARIFKLYGTWACKGKNLDERPHRCSRLLDTPDNCFLSKEQLEGLANIVRTATTTTKNTTTEGEAQRLDMHWYGLDDGKDKMRKWIAKYLGDDAIKSEGEWGEGYRFVLKTCPFNADHDNGEALIMVWDSEGRAFRCQHNSCSDYDWKALRKKVGDIPPSKQHKHKEERDADKILRLFGETEHEVFHSTDNLAFVCFAVDGQKKTLQIEGTAFADYLRNTFYTRHKQTISNYSLLEAIATIKATAMMEGKEYKMNLRVAYHQPEHAIYLDLANDNGDFVRITQEGWAIVNNAPVRFWRSPNQAALPTPIHGGNLMDLKQYINIADEDFPLIVGVLCDAIKGRGAYHVLSVSGKHGTGKSVLLNMVSMFLDPLKEAQTSGQPRNELDLAVMALAQHCIAIENVSSINSDLSDALCRISTGSGLRTRTLYTNLEQTSFGFCRPVVIDGIGENINAPDLLDRTIILHTAPMPDGRRKEKNELTQSFQQNHPALLGALLTIVSAGLGCKETDEDYNPRMLDAYRFMRRCATAMPYGATGFSSAYKQKRNEAKETAFDGSPIAAHFVEFVKDLLAKRKTPQVHLTSQELYNDFTSWAGQTGVDTRHFPQSARGLTNRLMRDDEALQAHGVSVLRPTTKDTAVKLYTIGASKV